MPTRARIALIGAAASSAVLALIWLLAFHTHLGGQADQSIFLGFSDLKRPHVDSLASVIAHVCDPGRFLVLAAVAVAIAFARGRARLALAVAAILLGANATTQVLKPLLAQTRPHWMIHSDMLISSASWPSGHATAAMSLTLALVLVAPSRWRPLAAALGAVFAVAVCYSFLTLGWHYPSDVLGGYLVAVTWTQLALGALFALDARRSDRILERDTQPLSLRAALTPAVGAVIGATVLAGLVAVARPHAVIAFVHLHKSFMLGAATIGALGLGLSTAVMLSVRGRDRALRTAGRWFPP
jgi:membrane-associated phospholipid phosphatase